MKLRKKLLEIPAMAERDFRDALLSFYPNKSLKRSDIPFADITHIINELAMQRLQQSGENTLLIFLDEAMSSIEGLHLHSDLEELRKLCEQEIASNNGKGPATKQEKDPPAYQLFNLHDFDLEESVKQFMEAIWEFQGLNVFGITCDYPDFHVIFGKRIAYELKGSIDIRPPFKLRFITVDKIMLAMKEYVDQVDKNIKAMAEHEREEYKRSKQYILFPVKVEETNSKTIEGLRIAACKEFKGNTEFLIIIILFGRSSDIFPHTIVPLDSPRFTKTDVHRWVSRVGDRLNWPLDRVNSEWKKNMLEASMQDGVLNMEYTYSYIKMIGNILGTHQACSFDDFLAQIEQRSLYYE